MWDLSLYSSFNSNFIISVFYNSKTFVIQFKIIGAVHMRAKMKFYVFAARARVFARLIAFYTVYLFSRGPCDDTDGSSGNMKRDREARR